MTISHGLIGIALAVSQVATPAPEPASTTTVIPVDGYSLGSKAAKPITNERAEAVRAQCSDRRFEATAEGLIDGEMKRRKITLCAAPGDSNAQWITKLENAVVWVKSQAGLSDPVKAKLVGDLQAKIGEVRYAAPARALPSGGLSPADALVATVPPMPPPLRTPTLSSATMMATAPPFVPRPPLTIRCLVAGERGGGSTCGRLGPDTVFAVHADGNLKSPVILRFMRRGELRAEMPVAALRQGQIVRLRLPPQICAGVVRADVAIEIMATQWGPSRTSLVADKVGPFYLHC